MKVKPNPFTLELLFGGVSVVSIGVVCIRLFVGFPTLPSALLLVSFTHSVSLACALWVAITQGLVSVPMSRPVTRGLISIALVGASYPAAALIFVSVVLGLTPTQFLDFDDHSAETFSRLDWLRNDIAIPLGFFLAGITVLLLIAAAVRMFIGRWPSRIWSASILIPLFIVCVAKMGVWFALRDYFVLVLPVFFVLGAVIGYWIKSAQKAVLAEPAALRGGV